MASELSEAKAIQNDYNNEDSKSLDIINLTLELSNTKEQLEYWHKQYDSLKTDLEQTTLALHEVSDEFIKYRERAPSGDSITTQLDRLKHENTLLIEQNSLLSSNAAISEREQAAFKQNMSSAIEFKQKLEKKLVHEKTLILELKEKNALLESRIGNSEQTAELAADRDAWKERAYRSVNRLASEESKASEMIRTLEMALYNERQKLESVNFQHAADLKSLESMKNKLASFLKKDVDGILAAKKKAETELNQKNADLKIVNQHNKLLIDKNAQFTSQVSRLEAKAVKDKQSRENSNLVIQSLTSELASFKDHSSKVEQELASVKSELSQRLSHEKKILAVTPPGLINKFFFANSIVMFMVALFFALSNFDWLIPSCSTSEACVVVSRLYAIANLAMAFVSLLVTIVPGVEFHSASIMKRVISFSFIVFHFSLLIAAWFSISSFSSSLLHLILFLWAVAWLAFSFKNQKARKNNNKKIY